LLKKLGNLRARGNLGDEPRVDSLLRLAAFCSANVAKAHFMQLVASSCSCIAIATLNIGHLFVGGISLARQPLSPARRCGRTVHFDEFA
jgi:hypothetical protein